MVMHRIVFVGIIQCGIALAPFTVRAASLITHRIRCVSFVGAPYEREPFHYSFGAPLPPVEISIDAKRVEVAAGLRDGDREASVVQQLRGSAPYVDLHRDSIMVVHLCSEILNTDAMFQAMCTYFYVMRVLCMKLQL